MELKYQVVSLDLAKKMNELGFEKDSLFHWCFYEEEWILECLNRNNMPTQKEMTFYSAYTVAELGEMLPRAITIKNIKYGLITEKLTWGWGCNYYNFNKNICARLRTKSDNLVDFSSTNSANAMAKTLIYLKENKLLEDQDERR